MYGKLLYGQSEWGEVNTQVPLLGNRSICGSIPINSLSSSSSVISTSTDIAITPFLVVAIQTGAIASSSISTIDTTKINTLTSVGSINSLSSTTATVIKIVTVPQTSLVNTASTDIVSRDAILTAINQSDIITSSISDSLTGKVLIVPLTTSEFSSASIDVIPTEISTVLTIPSINSASFTEATIVPINVLLYRLGGRTECLGKSKNKAFLLVNSKNKVSLLVDSENKLVVLNDNSNQVGC